MRTQQFLYIMYGSVNYINHVVHYIPGIITGSRYLLTAFFLPLPLAPGNHKSDLFFYEFFFDI